jgi:SNF2 family DNA or RNA helicase
MKDFVALGAFLGFTKSEVQGFTNEIRAKYVLRRTKHDVSEFNKRLELPPCDFRNVELEMHPEERTLYEDAFGRGREVVQSVAASTNQHMYNMQLLEALLRVRQVMAWPQMYLDGIAKKEDKEPEAWSGRSRKMEVLMEMVQSHPKEKALIFCQFIGEMDRIQELMHEAQIPTYRIDGGVDKEQREARIEAFKAVTYERQPVFLIQIKAGGVGLNLQQATRVYITSPAWNPATELQAIARAHRTGQTQKVTVRKLIYTGEEGGVTPDGRIRPALPSVEESILALPETKTKVCAEVLNDSRVLAQMPLTNPKVTIHALKKIFRV